MEKIFFNFIFVMLIATVNLSLAGLVDSYKEWAKFNDKYKPWMSHSAPIPYYIYCHTFGMLLNGLFCYLTGLWQIFPAYIFMAHQEDFWYYWWSIKLGYRTKGYPESLPWLVDDAPDFIKPLFTWLFESKQVYWEGYLSGLLTEVLVTTILTFLLILIGG